ncbi:MAG: hypothetical protein ACXV29_08670 [Halobacteriota archaeon]
MTDELSKEIDKSAPDFVYITTVPNFIDVRFFMYKNITAHPRFTYAMTWKDPSTRSGPHSVTAAGRGLSS